MIVARSFDCSWCVPRNFFTELSSNSWHFMGRVIYWHDQGHYRVIVAICFRVKDKLDLKWAFVTWQFVSTIPVPLNSRTPQSLLLFSEPLSWRLLKFLLLKDPTLQAFCLTLKLSAPGCYTYYGIYFVIIYHIISRKELDNTWQEIIWIILKWNIKF